MTGDAETPARPPQRRVDEAGRSGGRPAATKHDDLLQQLVRRRGRHLTTGRDDERSNQRPASPNDQAETHGTPAAG